MNTQVMPSGQQMNSASFKMNCTRATLYHINGQVSHIMLAAPMYTPDFSEQERAAIALREYVKVLARKYIAVKQFQIELGSINLHGQYVASGITQPMTSIQD